MKNHPVLVVLLTAVVSITAGCSTDTPGGKILYDDSQPPRLLDGEIRMETIRRLQKDHDPDVRVVRSRDGVITATYRSSHRGLEGSGSVPFSEWADLWGRIVDMGGFDQKPEEPDPGGGFFHKISFRIGVRRGETSAQNKSNFLGLGTVGIRERLDLANAITRLVEEHCETREIESKERTDPR